ncbi:MAG: tyrosine--tRNA ligase [Candidatus Phytoplasma australasiaticum]|nr:tyrosine--tRNA ligase [Candidatus Phytoplasma australasiaticum]
MHKLNYETVNFYCGFDPTAISLTIGHLVQINTILLLYNKGHTPFILIGQATSLVGDPKETKERNLLIPQEVVKNTQDITMQLKSLLPRKRVYFVNNYDWLSQINFLDFLRQYGKLFNIKYILSKKIISERLNNESAVTESAGLLYLYKAPNSERVGETKRLLRLQACEGSLRIWSDWRSTCADLRCRWTFPVHTCADLNYEILAPRRSGSNGVYVDKHVQQLRNGAYQRRSALCFLSVDGFELDVTVIASAFLLQPMHRVGDRKMK